MLDHDHEYLRVSFRRKSAIFSTFFRRSSKGASTRIESLEDFTAKFGLNTSPMKSAEGQKKEANNNVKVDLVVRRANKGVERESSVERRKSSIQ